MHRLLSAAPMFAGLALAATAPAFFLDTSGRLGDLTWNDGQGSSASASIEYIAIGDDNWNTVFSFFNANRFQSSTHAGIVWLNEVVAGDPAPGALSVPLFGVYEFSGFAHPVVGLEADLVADEDLLLAFDGDDSIANGPFDPVQKGYVEFNQLLYDGFELKFNRYLMTPIDWMPDGGASGYVVPPPVTYLDERYFLFGSLRNTSDDPDLPYYVLTLQDGFKMTLNANLVSTGVPVPEPATLALGAGALLAALRRRRR
ncbi:MAG: PEP-CTERM sorting domain-containing protein [Fimbriimonadales bacterium]|nr:PEP-CTERM sorting domain-containing protein [Fimbriimonadales bacterium]